MKKTMLMLIAILFVCITAFLTYKTFFASFGPVLVDYVAFAAGIILLTDGFLSLKVLEKKTFKNLFFIYFRFIIGVCIFTIHLLQYLRDGKLGVY